MDGLISAGLLNAALATLLAGLALAITAAWKNPYVARLAWLAVLLKLLTPPLLFIPVAAAWLPQSPQEPAPDAVFETAGTVAIEFDSPLATETTPATTTRTSGIESLGATDAPAAATPSLPSASTSTVGPTAALAAPPTKFAPLTIVPLIWLTGSLLLCVLSIARIVRLHRFLTRALPSTAPLEQRTAALAAKLGLHAPPRICIVPGRVAPFAWSLGRRATIVLPAALVDSLDADALDAVIAHELTHLRRRDGWARWLELAATIAYWWCPTVWFARRRLHAAEEECCDADVLRRFPALRRGYGQALLQTLDLLTGDTALAPGATGWGSRRSLRRRFERIGRREMTPSLRPWGSRVCWTAIALFCLTAPIAVSSEQAATESASQSSTNEPTSVPAAEPPASPYTPTDDSTPCTITLSDGSTINGIIVDRDLDRLIVLREQTLPSQAVSPQATPSRPRTVYDSLKTWDLTLEECIEIAFDNLPGCHTSTKTDLLGRLVLTQEPANQHPLIDFQCHASDTLRDVIDCYWELRFAWQEIAIRRKSQDAALATWRRVKAKAKVGAEGGGDSEEAQARSAFFLCRTQLETANSNLFRVENRLRFLMRIAADDGRIISPATQPETHERRIDWSLALIKATANRDEVRRQKAKIEQCRKLHSAAKAAVVESDAPTLADRVATTKARHAQLLTAREEAVLQDIQLSVSHQLSDAVRDIDQTYGAMQTNLNREQAANDEVAAVEKLYESGRTTLDLLLQANQRRGDAACTYQRSLVDYARAQSRLEMRQGTLLEAHNFTVAE